LDTCLLKLRPVYNITYSYFAVKLFEYVHNILWIWNRKDEQLKQHKHKKDGFIMFVQWLDTATGKY